MLWQKKGVAHEVFLTEKGGLGHLKILVQKGGSSYLFIVEKNLTCNDYCYHRELAIIVVLPVRGRVCSFAVSSPSQIRASVKCSSLP